MKMMTNFSLLKNNTLFRNTFIARTVSLLTIGMLVVALPQQIYSITQDSFHVATVVATEGLAMFIGLLLGGFFSDLYDRKYLILGARLFCGLGFLGLYLNSLLLEPSISAIYFLSAWDGFFGAIGVTAMMAIMPKIVGHENLLQARAISMVFVRLATIISPALGGILIAQFNIGFSYLVATIGTALTIFLLTSLPNLKPNTQAQQPSPLFALGQSIQFLFKNKIVGSTVLIGTVLTFASAIRITFPALAHEVFHVGAFELGLLYCMVPLGATLGALFSAWVENLQSPGKIMLIMCMATFVCFLSIGFIPIYGVVLGILILFGYFMSVANLLQYTIVQNYTPDDYLGRINAIWLAQDAFGDAVTTSTLGLLTKLTSVTNSLHYFGVFTLLFGVFAYLKFDQVQQARLMPVDSKPH